MKLAVVRSIGSACGFRNEQDVADIEQELVDQFALVVAAARISAQMLRTDRILLEVQATGGDVRRICDLFGIDVESVARYRGILDPDLTTQPAESN